MKIVMTAGGGGHFSPLLCIYNVLPKIDEVLVIGRQFGFEGDSAVSLEYQTAKRLGMRFVAIDAARFQRKFTRHTIPSLLKFPKGLYQAYAALRLFRPDVVLSFGGYVSAPVIIAAWLLRIPIVIHEQTLEAGFANKIASFFAKKICISWESSREFFPPEKTVVTGNPVRIFNPLPDGENSKSKIQNPNKLPVVYITGGSLGAHAINVLVEGCIERLLEKFVVIHQTGDARQYRDFERLDGIKNNLLKKLQERYILNKFVEPESMGYIMQKADVVVARSGINTITELLYFGKPSLLIPLPFSQRNEQEKNAQFFASTGLGEVAKQETLTPESLYLQICNMITKKDVYEKHKQEAQSRVSHNVEEKILAVVKSIVVVY